jgi:PST family polysaccharide transporter
MIFRRRSPPPVRPTDDAGSGVSETASTTSGPPGGVPEAGVGTSLVVTVRRGASWTVLARTGAVLVQFVAGIVLARLLLPEDFGIAAMLYAFSGFAILFVDLGIGPAVVQKARLSERDKSTAFWVNAIAGVLLTVLLGLCGPLLAGLFDEPELRTLTWLVALNFSLSLGVVHSAMLEREFRFGVVAGST